MPASRKREYPVPDAGERRLRRDARGRFIGYDDLADAMDRDVREATDRDIEPGADEYEARMLH